MRTTEEKLSFKTLPTTYAGLCKLLTPRPIHDEAEFRNVLKITDAMAGHALSTDQEDYFDLLCRLVEDWEKPRIDKPRATSTDTLRVLLEAHGMTAADLSRLLGVHRTLGPMLLRGERKLTVKHIKKLANYFGVSTDAFID